MLLLKFQFVPVWEKKTSEDPIFNQLYARYKNNNFAISGHC